MTAHLVKGREIVPRLSWRFSFVWRGGVSGHRSLFLELVVPAEVNEVLSGTTPVARSMTMVSIVCTIEVAVEGMEQLNGFED